MTSKKKKDEPTKVVEIKIDEDDALTLTLLTVVLKLMKQLKIDSVRVTEDDEDARYESNVGFDFPEDSEDCIVRVLPRSGKDLN